MEHFNLPTYCKAHDLDNVALAKLLGISIPYASQLRRGKKRVTLTIGLKLSERLRVPLGAFFKGTRGRTNNHNQ